MDPCGSTTVHKTTTIANTATKAERFRQLQYFLCMVYGAQVKMFNGEKSHTPSKKQQLLSVWAIVGRKTTQGYDFRLVRVARQRPNPYSLLLFSNFRGYLTTVLLVKDPALAPNYDERRTTRLVVPIYLELARGLVQGACSTTGYVPALAVASGRHGRAEQGQGDSRPCQPRFGSVVGTTGRYLPVYR